MYNLGEIENRFGATITISRDTWAPGIWAGIEKFPIIISHNDITWHTMVMGVDLQNRKIFLLNKVDYTVIGGKIYHDDGYYEKNLEFDKQLKVILD